MSSSFARLATVTASTKRRPAVSGGKMSETWTTSIASLKCTPLDPLTTAEADAAARRLNLNTPYNLRETYVDGSLDIVQGDKLVVGSVEYPIREAAPWDWRGAKYLHLVVEELKK